MRVACPECAAEYDLPPAFAARLSEGRTLRCARCGTTWPPGASASVASSPDAPVPVAASPPPEAPASPIPAPPSPAAEAPPAPFESDLSDALAAIFTDEDPPPPHTERPEPSPARAFTSSAWVIAFAWTGSILLLFGAAAAAWHWRFDLVEAWPPAVRAFIALGLAG